MSKMAAEVQLLPPQTASFLNQYRSELTSGTRARTRTRTRTAARAKKSTLHLKPAFENETVRPAAVAVRELAWNEEPDALTLEPWRQFAGRLLFLTALPPTILHLWSTRTHAGYLWDAWGTDVAPSRPWYWRGLAS